MRFAKRKGTGKTARRVEDLLLDKLNPLYPGIGIDGSQDFWFQRGAYTHATFDCAAWGADIPFDGKTIVLYSWDTMKQCCKTGIELIVNRGDLCHTFEVVAKSDPL